MKSTQSTTEFMIKDPQPKSSVHQVYSSKKVPTTESSVDQLKSATNLATNLGFLLGIFLKNLMQQNSIQRFESKIFSNMDYYVNQPTPFYDPMTHQRHPYQPAYHQQASPARPSTSSAYRRPPQQGYQHQLPMACSSSRMMPSQQQAFFPQSSRHYAQQPYQQ